MEQLSESALVTRTAGPGAVLLPARGGGGPDLRSSEHPTGIAARSAYGILARGRYGEIANFWRSPCQVQRPNRRHSAGDQQTRLIRCRAATTAPAASPETRELGIDNPHPLIASMWKPCSRRASPCFTARADWARLRLELWYCNFTMASGRPSGSAWEAVQHGLNELLLSPAVKRRAGIEVRPQGVDADAELRMKWSASTSGV